MRSFAGYKDKRVFVKRAPGAIAGRFILDFPYEIRFLLFRLALGFGVAGQRLGGFCAANGLNFSLLPSPSVVKLLPFATLAADRLSPGVLHTKRLTSFVL